MDESLPDFTGRVVGVYVVAPPVSLALEQARYERHLGKLYLVGRQVANPDRPAWDDGVTYYIAPEQIAYFAVFDSLSLYLSRIAGFAAQVAAAQAANPTQQQKRGWFGRGG
jgi:hypothetical protein